MSTPGSTAAAVRSRLSVRALEPAAIDDVRRFRRLTDLLACNRATASRSTSAVATRAIARAGRRDTGA